MSLDLQTIKQLREMTGAGMVEAKTVLEEAKGDIDAAIRLLRERGLKTAQKKEGRTTHEGYIGSYVHSNGKVGVMVELLCETDFVARNEQFKALAKDVAMHVAASNPRYLKIEDVPSDIVDAERAVYRKQLEGEKKPAEILEKIVDGKLAKFYDDNCLLRQHFVKDETMTIAGLLTSAIQKIGEKIEIGKFTRFEI
ncbi:elongation factor Ts [Candidatus Uhrbacteria bacterium]|nr:elongation factor Ts [Candidatus Uhrbacteria bacterium]